MASSLPGPANSGRELRRSNYYYFCCNYNYNYYYYFCCNYNNNYYY